MRKWLQLAKEMFRKDPRLWNRVLCIDEFKFNFFQSDKKNLCKTFRYTLKTVKHGDGSTVIWNDYFRRSVSPIVKSNNILILL